MGSPGLAGSAQAMMVLASKLQTELHLSSGQHQVYYQHFLNQAGDEGLGEEGRQLHFLRAHYGPGAHGYHPIQSPDNLRNLSLTTDEDIGTQSDD